MLSGTGSWNKTLLSQHSAIRGFHTLRLRHDLQFIDSRGSLLMRRAGSLSMPTWGRDIVIECTPGGGGATPVASKGTVIPKVMKGIRRGRRQPVPIYQVKNGGI